MDKFVKGAIDVASECGVTVCDYYSKWKQLTNKGEDPTALLSNGINHSATDMLNLFAGELVNIILQ